MLKVQTLFFLFCLALFSECHGIKKLDWWQKETIYQIYPRSFKDSNGDGIGDLPGVLSKLEYIKSLGAGAIWFSPIYDSPMADFGYDISNFHDIWPKFGTLEDFENILKKAKELGLKVLMDFVPNHTSDEHEWFQKSVEGIPPYKDYYVWKDPKFIRGVRSPPNSWNSVFGNSAWEWNEKRQQYYFHQFAIQQPDLDYRNPIVYEEMKNVIKFWLDKGVDGFRVDALDWVYENPAYPEEPLSHDPKALPTDYDYYVHVYSKNQPEMLDLVKDWRVILDEYSRKTKHTKFMMTETYGSLEYVMGFYGTPKHPGVHFPFNFMFLEIKRSDNATYIKDRIKSWYDKMPSYGWANWVLGNHDQSRVASRFGTDLVDGMQMIQLLLPGTAIVYQGDEIAMVDTFLNWDQIVDPPGINAGPTRYYEFTRDKNRTPVQWDSSKNAGFTTSNYTWLPVNPNYWRVNIEDETKLYSRITHLQVFKILTHLRKSLIFHQGDLDLYTISDWVFVMVRSFKDHPTFVVLINFGSDVVTVNLRAVRSSLPKQMNIVVPSVNSNYHINHLLNTNSIELRPKASVVLATSEQDVIKYII